MTASDIVASDLRVLAALVPAGWRAAVFMGLTILLFPAIITVMVVHTLAHDMPEMQGSMQRAVSWVKQRIHLW